jgi:hypothetical protein
MDGSRSAPPFVRFKLMHDEKMSGLYEARLGLQNREFWIGPTSEGSFVSLTAVRASGINKLRGWKWEFETANDVPMEAKRWGGSEDFHYCIVDAGGIVGRVGNPLSSNRAQMMQRGLPARIADNVLAARKVYDSVVRIYGEKGLSYFVLYGSSLVKKLVKPGDIDLSVGIKPGTSPAAARKRAELEADVSRIEAESGLKVSIQLPEIGDWCNWRNIFNSPHLIFRANDSLLELREGHQKDGMDLNLAVQFFADKMSQAMERARRRGEWQLEALYARRTARGLNAALDRQIDSIRHYLDELPQPLLMREMTGFAPSTELRIPDGTESDVQKTIIAATVKKFIVERHPNANFARELNELYVEPIMR